MTEAIPLYVLDASVAIKWIIDLEDEPHTEQAREALADYEAGRINVVAPSVMPYEVGHALGRAVRRGRIESADALDAYRTLLDWNVPLVHDELDMLSSLRLVALFDPSFYDASYFPLAERLGAPLLYADAHLRKMPGPGGVRPVDAYPACWIEDYLPVRT
jgi:predicted nucleic acid-binding protein